MAAEYAYCASVRVLRQQSEGLPAPSVRRPISLQARQRADGSFEFYSEAEHGPNRWAPGPEADPDKPGDAAELIEASISLERDVEEFMADHLDELESGLVLIDRQVDTDAGRIDILAKDASGRVVIIELKVGKAGDSVVGQLARYLGWWRRAKGEAARGFIVAAEIPETVMYAASVLPDVSLRRYQVHVSFAPSGFADDAQ